MTVAEHEWLPDAAASTCRVGDRLRVTGPDGTTYLTRVQRVCEASSGGRRSLVAAITEPRRLRGSVVILEVP